MKTIIEFVKKEAVLFIFLSLLAIVTILHPYEIISYPSFVDWRTIIALTGLLVTTTGLKESRYFNVFSRKVLKRLKSEKKSIIFFTFAFSITINISHK